MVPRINCSLREAKAYTDGDHLVVTTGVLRREWKWTGRGFATCAIVDLRSQRSWAGEVSGCDWQLPDGSEPTDAIIHELTATVQDDQGFTSEHIAVTVEIDYPSSGLVVCWTVWVYPDSPGIRTQLAAKTTGSMSSSPAARFQGSPHDARVDCIPVAPGALYRRYLGYYNGTQQRNDTHLDILREERVDHPVKFREWCDWASVAGMEDGAGGIALVKESHKCVNQTGHVTGGFVCDEKGGLSCTGWGVRPSELSSRAFTPGWATWCVAWSGGDLDRELAFKAFDRLRYPIDPERDVYIQANTWGSTDNGHDARRAACEESVLRELETCAELSVDVLQIDDGWQVPPGHEDWQPGENGWRPHPACYPNGWARIRARAAELGIKLGLWAAAVPISLDELKTSFTEGGFLQYKLDFAILKTRADIDALMEKVRDFIAWTGHRVRVNWDVTENPPRYGYFFAREYGSIYLENRKPVRPANVVYRPHTVLRDLWQVSKYLNLHRFQCSIQNVDRVDKALSDAHLHSHSYAAAIALMGIPLFFLETKYYSAAAKAEIRALLDVYKKHRLGIYQGIVHPIGSKPNNARWAGFQCHIPRENRGYLMIFRERCNPNAQHELALGWIHAGQINLTDLMTNRSWQQNITPDGTTTFSIPEAPGFLFLEYSLQAQSASPSFATAAEGKLMTGCCFGAERVRL